MLLSAVTTAIISFLITLRVGLAEEWGVIGTAGMMVQLQFYGFLYTYFIAFYVTLPAAAAYQLILSRLGARALPEIMRSED